MLIASSVFVAIAALLHVYIFVMESFLWTTPSTRAKFGNASTADAEITKPLAYNQGFYNLFLAVAAALGVVFIAAGNLAVGATLVFVGAGSMVLAGLVLVTSNPTMLRGALIQVAAPAIGVVLLAIGLAG